MVPQRNFSVHTPIDALFSYWSADGFSQRSRSRLIPQALGPSILLQDSMYQPLGDALCIELYIFTKLVRLTGPEELMVDGSHDTARVKRGSPQRNFQTQSSRKN
jgi:hypothetical protein